MANSFLKNPDEELVILKSRVTKLRISYFGHTMKRLTGKGDSAWKNKRQEEKWKTKYEMDGLPHYTICQSRREIIQVFTYHNELVFLVMAILRMSYRTY